MWSVGDTGLVRLVGQVVRNPGVFVTESHREQLRQSPVGMLCYSYNGSVNLSTILFNTVVLYPISDSGKRTLVGYYTMTVQTTGSESNIDDDVES